MKTARSRRLNGLIIILLIAVDQGLKHLAEARYYFGKELVSGWLAIAPSVNSNQTWLGLWIPLLREPVPATAVNLLALGVILWTWRHGEKYRAAAPNMVAAIWILSFSGGLCSLIDKLFWNGSLDYFVVRGRFVFDLKDLYVAAAELLFLIAAVSVFYRNPDHPKTPRRTASADGGIPDGIPVE